MYKKLTGAALVLALSILFLWLSFTYLLPISLPFLLGSGLALLAEPMVRLFSQRLHWKPTLATAIGVSAVCLLTVAVLTVSVSLFMRHLVGLSHFWPQLEATFTNAIDALRQWLLDLSPRMPEGIRHLIDRFTQDLLSDSNALLSGLLSRLPQLATGLLGNLSAWLFGIVTGIISGYMISVRLPKLRLWLKDKLPERWQTEFLPAVRSVKKAFGGWILAELKLATVAFALLLAGFLLLGLQHSFTLAALITLVDAFPVLGVGTVLLPWSALRLIQGDRALGFGLLGLYAVIWLVRSILEPKLIGKELGLDPLVTLVCIYAGFRLWGLSGMLLAPIIAMAATQIYRRLKQ